MGILGEERRGKERKGEERRGEGGPPPHHLPPSTPPAVMWKAGCEAEHKTDVLCPAPAPVSTTI